MAQGKALTEWQRQEIRATWLLTENGSESARRAGCSASTANKYIRDNGPELRQLRQEKRPEIVAVIRALLDRTLSAAFDGRKIDEASFAQLVTGAAILVDKHQLLTGKATERIETRDLSQFSDDQIERLARVAAEVAGGERVP